MNNNNNNSMPRAGAGSKKMDLSHTEQKEVCTYSARFLPCILSPLPANLPIPKLETTPFKHMISKAKTKD